MKMEKKFLHTQYILMSLYQLPNKNPNLNHYDEHGNEITPQIGPNGLPINDKVYDKNGQPIKPMFDR